MLSKRNKIRKTLNSRIGLSVHSKSFYFNSFLVSLKILIYLFIFLLLQAAAKLVQTIDTMGEMISPEKK